MTPLFDSFDTLSPAVRGQLEGLARLWRAHLGPDITALYLHGSLALGRFQEAGSDLDLLAVTARPLPRRERLAIIRDILAADKRPCPLELSALCLADLRPWRHPARCQLHYSGKWTAHYRRILDGGPGESFLLDGDFPDPDIACHVRLTRERGIPLLGPPPGDILPAVPEADFWQSIRADAEEGGLLTLARVLSYRRTGRILSKYDAALWAMEIVPEALRHLLEEAVREKYCGGQAAHGAGEDAAALRRWLLAEIGISGEMEEVKRL